MIASKVYLIPTPIAEDVLNTLSPVIKEVVIGLRYFIVEEIRTARRFLRKLDSSFPVDDCTFYIYNEHSEEKDIEEILKAIDGHHIGIMSEAGLPCVADPGSMFVRAAHRRGLQIVPLSGPSSIFMALMASGLDGQQFAFRGYISAKKEKRADHIRELARQSAKERITQIVMDAPYRNHQLFDDLCMNLPSETLMCVAANISGENEFIRTMRISEWKGQKIEINKIPALFLFQCFS